MLAKQLNTCMKRLSRILVPLQLRYGHKYGQDTYGYTTQTTMIPMLYELPKLSALPDNEDT